MSSRKRPETVTSNVTGSSTSTIMTASPSNVTVTTVIPKPVTAKTVDASEWTKALLDRYVDSRVGSEWLQSDVDVCLGYTTKIRAAGKTPTAIETFVKQRAFSPWRQDMADQVHAMVKEL